MGYRRIVAILLAIFMLGITPVAAAHDVVISSNPADGSTISEFPRKITLEFSGIPKDSFNTVAVSNSKTSEVLFRTNPELQDQFVAVDVPDEIQPGAGDYLVGFQITSSDGHATRGKIEFSVSGPEEDTAKDIPATSATNEAAEPKNTAQSSMTGWYVGGAALVVLAVFAAFVFVQRK